MRGAVDAMKNALPPGVRQWFRRRRRALWIACTGRLALGWPRRLHPLSPHFGYDRGLPIDRYYIEQFLSAHPSDIRGRVLEMGDAEYTRRFGGARVTQSDVLHVVEGNPLATIVADLTAADGIPADTFDCVILTQTLQMIYDVRAAIRHLHRILKPGGVLLATSHGTSRICRRVGRDPWGEYWRFTTQSSQRLFAETFPPHNVTVRLTAISSPPWRF
jgi:SAM-dependent methyltransferase